MNRSRKTSSDQRALRVLLGFVALCSLWACANIGMPEGGPFDSTPPRLIAAQPEVRALRVQGQRLELEFDEFIKLNEQNRIIISPPQLKQPLINAIGKKVTIKLLDSLQPNTTYSIYFDDVIVDNNEDNPLEHFGYTFSTGDQIDTMQIAGTVLNAETLEPMADLVLGAYWAGDVSDSTILKQRFPFASKTSKAGRFTIRGLRDSAYYIFALKDDDQNFRYDGLSEGLAFDPTVYRTSKRDSLKTDTIKIDSIVRRDTLYRDSLVTYDHTYYYPDDLVLRYFKPANPQRGLERSSRPDSIRIILEFAEELQSAPALQALEQPGTPAEDLYFPSLEGRTVTYWLKDRTLIHADSIRFSLSYAKTDSLLRLSMVTDTLTFHQPRAKRGDKKDGNPLKLSFSGASGARAGTLRDSLVLTSSLPLAMLSSSMIRLEVNPDSIYRPQSFSLEQDTLNTLRYNLRFDRQYGAKYRATIDSAAIHSIYGHSSDSTSFEQSIQAEQELGALQVSIEGLEADLYVQLLDQKGAVLLTERALRGMTTEPSDSLKVEDKLQVLFPDLKPADYYLRLFVDEDGNGQWTTGAYPQRQPEWMYYSPAKYPVKKGFTTSETWQPTATPLERQKPLDITEAKPEEKKKREDKNKEYQKRMADKKR